MAVQAQPIQVTCREYLGWRFGVGVPYLDFLVDLAGINARRPLPKIPQTFVEASVRMASLRRRQLLARGAPRPLVARPLHALEDHHMILDASRETDVRGQQNQHDLSAEGSDGLAGRPVAFPLGTVLSSQGVPVGGGRGAPSQQESRQDPRHITHTAPPVALVDASDGIVKNRHLFRSA